MIAMSPPLAQRAKETIGGFIEGDIKGLLFTPP